METKLRFKLFVIILSVISTLLYNSADAVEFKGRDMQVDLPVLSEPNNAVTPRMAADNNGHVYVAWSDNRGGSPSIYTNTFFQGQGWFPRSIPINTGFPKPKDTTVGDAISPRICSDDSGHVYVVWVDDRAVKAETGKSDIYFRYSKNYGVTWYPEFTDERIDSDNPGMGDSRNLQIACDGNGNVYVVWEDDRNAAGKYEVYFRSLQVQFSKPVDFIVYYQTPDIRLNTGVDAGKFNVRRPVISTDKRGNIYAAWQDSREIPEDEVYPGIYFNVSNNHGATWKSESTKIDNSPIGGFISFTPPAISNDVNGHVYVAWTDDAGRAARSEKFKPDGTADVYFNRSSDYGITWDEDTRIERAEVRAEAKNISIASNNKGLVCIAWADNSGAFGKQGISENYNIFINHSENFGSTFLDSDSNIRIDTWAPPGKTAAADPIVRIDDIGNTFVAWIDKFPDVYNIYFNFSIEKGRKNSWLFRNIMVLDYQIPPGNSGNQIMTIDNTGHVYIAWQDTRSALAEGNYNIFFISGFLDIERLLIAGQRLGEACFIATAAYGSPFERHVEILREFRDRYLLTNTAGRWFVAAYYKLSPPAAYLILKHSYLQTTVRIVLLPAVGVAMLFVYTTIWQKFVLMLTALLIIGGVYFIIARHRKKEKNERIMEA